MTHICVSKLIIVGSENGLLPERHQAIICTNAEILLIGPVETTFIEILNEKRNSYMFIQENVFENVVWKVAPFCVGLNDLKERHIMAIVPHD